MNIKKKSQLGIDKINQIMNTQRQLKWMTGEEECQIKPNK